MPFCRMLVLTARQYSHKNFVQSFCPPVLRAFRSQPQHIHNNVGLKNESCTNNSQYISAQCVSLKSTKVIVLLSKAVVERLLEYIQHVHTCQSRVNKRDVLTLAEIMLDTTPKLGVVVTFCYQFRLETRHGNRSMSRFQAKPQSATELPPTHNSMCT